MAEKRRERERNLYDDGEKKEVLPYVGRRKGYEDYERKVGGGGGLTSLSHSIWS